MEEIREKKIILWKDGVDGARGGYFFRSDLKTFFNRLIEAGETPVGVVVDLESFNLEILVEPKPQKKDDTTKEE